MACGTPELSAANPKMEELIEPGVNGALWNGTPESLGRAIVELIQTPSRLKSWGEQAKQKLTPTYLQHHCLNELEKLLEQQSSCF